MSSWVAVPVASIVSLSVVQIVNGFVTRNGHRHVGFRNENPGRPPAVCTKVTSFEVTAGCHWMSRLPLVGSMTRSGPAVIGVSPMSLSPV
jgi:hypothetical protein